MKIAFVAGFHDPVKQKLDEHYSAQQANGSLVWVRQRERRREVDLTLLSARVLEPIRGTKEVRVRVVLHVPSGREWIVGKVEGILRKGQELNPALQCDPIVQFGDDGDDDGALVCIREFDLPAPTGISAAAIREKIPEGTILCVSHQDKTSILKALEHAKLAEDAKQLFEERIEGGRNSNLAQEIARLSLKYRYILYAYDGLRHIGPAIQHKYIKVWNRSSASQVVEQFKKWIMEGD